MNTLALLDDALCVRLLVAMGHFFWQATAIALVALIAARLLRRRSAQARYVLFVAALLLTAACLPATFAVIDTPQSPSPAPVKIAGPVQSIEYTDDATSRPLPMLKTQTAWTPAAPLQAIEPGSAVGINESSEASTEKPAGETGAATAAAWQQYAPQLIACYTACVAIMMLRLLVGLHGGRRLRRGSQPVQEAAILTAVAGIAASLRMRVAPAVAYCRRVAVPTVVGVIRPMVLLPVTFATGLDGEQIRAILTHELAHIRRWDHVVNLLQRIVEAVLFFHPAVWLLSRRIRIERENCCDDVVVAAGSKAHHYVESLIRVAELGLAGRSKPAAAAALAAADRPSALRVRIARLLGVSANKHETHRLRRTWPAAIVLAGLMTIATVFVSCQSKETGKPDSPLLTAAYNTLKDSPYLSDLRSPDPEINRHIADLRSSDKHIRYEAMSALGFAGPKAISAIPELARLFKDRVGDEKEHARTALEKIIAYIPATGSVTSYTTPEINRYVADLCSSDKKVRFEAVRALGEMGPAAAPAVPALLMDMIGNKINRGRGYSSNADSALREIYLPLPRDVPAVAGMLKDDSMHVRQLALQLLGGLAYRRGGDGILESVIPHVVEQLSVSDFSVQSWAIGVLYHLGPRAASATGAIATLLTHKERSLRWGAAEALGAIGPAAREAVPALARALSDSDPKVRCDAAMALGNIGPDAAVAAPQLAELALRPSDIYYGGDVEAMNALRRIGPLAMEELKKAAAGTDDTASSARAVLEKFRSSQVQGWARKVINNKYRNVAIWNAVKWGKAETDSDGNLSIRCKYLVTRGKDNQLFEQVFTFTPEGEYVGVETLSKKPAKAAATQPAKKPDMKQRQEMLIKAVNAETFDRKAAKAALEDVGNAYLRFEKGPLDAQPDRSTLPQSMNIHHRDGKYYLSMRDGFNRIERGPAPDEWLDRLAAARKDGFKLKTATLVAALTEEIRLKRDKLLDEADAKICEGLLKLAEDYPQLQETGQGRTLKDQLKSSHPQGRISIWADRLEGPKGGSEPVPLESRYSVLVVIRPLHYYEKNEMMPQLVESFLTEYGNLALMGQVGCSAGDAKLDAALKKLVSDALAPLKELNAKAGEGKADAATQPETKPADEPATKPDKE